MLPKKFSQLVLTLCLCSAGGLGWTAARADPAAMYGVSASEDGDMTVPGMGLKLPQALAAHDAKAAPAATAPAASPVAPAVKGKSLLTAARGVDNKPRLGPELDAGMASWYGSRFHNRRTASGAKFDRYALTAAHKTLPLGTQVIVSNPRTGKQIVVRINDRGPYIGNRILDLSEAAASALGLKARGHDWVVMNAVLPPSDVSDAVAYTAAAASAPADAGDSAVAADVAQQTLAGNSVANSAAPLAEVQTTMPIKKEVPTLPISLPASATPGSEPAVIDPSG